MDATRKQARIAGALYLLLAISAPFGLLYVPSAVIVSGNAAETANHLRGAETLVRIGIASELFHQTVAIFLVLALYRLFKPVNDALAQQLVILGALVSVPIVFVNVRLWSRRTSLRRYRPSEYLARVRVQLPRQADDSL